MSNAELIAESRKFLATPNLGKSMARELEKAMIHIRRLADIAESAEARVKELEAGEWQYSYFEKWADGSGVYERVTFRTLEEARKYFDGNGDMDGWNAEVKEKDRLVAGVEKRRVVEPGPWVPVESEGE